MFDVIDMSLLSIFVRKHDLYRFCQLLIKSSIKRQILSSFYVSFKVAYINPILICTPNREEAQQSENFIDFIETLPIGFSWQLFVNAMRLKLSKKFVIIIECFD
jgi:hypothetical protein